MKQVSLFIQWVAQTYETSQTYHIYWIYSILVASHSRYSFLPREVWVDPDCPDIEPVLPSAETRILPTRQHIHIHYIYYYVFIYCKNVSGLFLMLYFFIVNFLSYFNYVLKTFVCIYILWYESNVIDSKMLSLNCLKESFRKTPHLRRVNSWASVCFRIKPETRRCQRRIPWGNWSYWSELSEAGERGTRRRRRRRRDVEAWRITLAWSLGRGKRFPVAQEITGSEPEG